MDAKDPGMIISVYGYNADHLVTQNMNEDISAIPSFLQQWKGVWIRILHPERNKPLLLQLFQMLHIASKQLDYLLDPTHLAHVTFFSTGMLKVSHVLYYDFDLLQQQTTYFLGKNFLLSFHNELSVGAEEVAMMLGNKDLPVRQGSADLLFYHLLNASINTYLRKVSHVGDGVDLIEDKLATDPNDFEMAPFFTLRKKLTGAKRDLWMQRDIFSQIAIMGQTNGQSVIQPETVPLFQHCAERASEILDLMETYIDHYRGLLDVYFSSTSNQINQVMKILTIFSAIFLPLSFLAGLWGMNFDYSNSHWNMPELHTEYGYPCALLFMLIIVISLMFVFRRVGWITLGKKKLATEDIALQKDL